MDVFALQEELEAGRNRVSRAAAAVLRARVEQRIASPAPTRVEQDAVGPSSHLEENQTERQASDTEASVEGREVTFLHPSSAEYKLRQSYDVFFEQVVGKGGFGEVFLGQLFPSTVKRIGLSSPFGEGALSSPYSSTSPSFVGIDGRPQSAASCEFKERSGSFASSSSATKKVYAARLTRFLPASSSS